MQSMQLTDWLVYLFIGAIVLVLLDGVRRKLAERRNQVVLKLDKNLPRDDGSPDEMPNSELPNGGARTLRREGRPVPSLRTLQSKRKQETLSRLQRQYADEAPAARAAPLQPGDAAAGSVPVLLDTIDIEEEHIEHTNVFSSGAAAESFRADSFTDDVGAPRTRPRDAAPPAAGVEPEEHIDGLDEEFEEDAMTGTDTVARQSGYMETRYQGRDDDEYDDDEYDDEEDEEDEEEEEEEDLDELESEFPDEFDDDYEDEDEDEDEDEEDYDDYDDDDDDYEDDEYEDDEDEDEDEEDEEDDELGFPEDDWGEEEKDALVDDYESEPVLLQDAVDKAAKGFVRPEPTAAPPRIEPGFGEPVSAAAPDEYNEPAFTEDFSAAMKDEDAGQGELFHERPGPAESPRPEVSRASVAREGLMTALGTGVPRAARDGLMAAFQRAAPARAQGADQAPPPASHPLPVQEVIIINVMARPGQLFSGRELLSVLRDQGLRLGDMSIFHRHADTGGGGGVMFSMANIVKPGTFELAAMGQFTTPGVSFFLQMPNKLGNMACFERMLGAATAVRNALSGELKDEHRSVFTRQTVEHCRQRVRDFELKLLSRK